MIIFINGTISSGKSTVAKLIKNAIPNTAILEIDVLRNLIDWIPLNEAIPINLENVVSLIKNFINRNLNVVVPYPLSQKYYDYLIKELNGVSTEIYSFTLNPDSKELIKSKRGRNLDSWEKERIDYHTRIGLTNPSFGKIIDNTNQTPEETVDIILKSLNKK